MPVRSARRIDAEGSTAIDLADALGERQGVATGPAPMSSHVSFEPACSARTSMRGLAGPPGIGDEQRGDRGV
jgi:hypothetical protein